MRRAVFLLCVCFLYGTAEATPTGNPAFPKVIEEGFIFSPAFSFSFRLGYEGNFIMNRRLEQDEGALRRVKSFSMDLNSGILTLNLLKRLDVYATYGGGKIKAEWLIEETPNSLTYLEVESKYGDMWSIGSKIIFFEWGKSAFSAGGRYFYSDPKVSCFSKGAEVMETKGSNIKFEEWQIDIGLSYKSDIFIPYLCAKYSKAKTELSVNDTIISSDGKNQIQMKNKNNYGMALGCTFSNSKYFMLNAEVRLIDEEAFTVSGELKF